MSSIVVVGGCIVDLISYTQRFPRPGETIAGKHFVKGPGGKGANQCVMAQKLGAKTALIAKLGNDTFGQEYMKGLLEMNIESEFVTFSKTSHTSTAAITVSEEGQNTIVYVPGAIEDLTPSDICAAENLIKNAKILLGTHECPLPTLTTAFQLASTHKIKTVLNAAPTAESSYESLYNLADIICLNEVEAEDATGIPVTDVNTAAMAINKLQEKGCSTVILTLGSKGAIFISPEQDNHVHVSAKLVKAIDSTGAGDAFMGSFVFFLSEFPEWSLKRAIEASCNIATLSVLKKGTQSSFPNREDIPNELFQL